jgi:hypothetical protein
MISFPEQLSAARSRQFDAQLNFMSAMTAQALATAGQVLALNISTSRASVERTANTVRQLFSITDPRDLFTVGSQAQEQLSSLFAYGQELFNIAQDARQNLSRQGAAAQPGQEPTVAQAAQPVQEPMVEQQAPQAAAPAAAAAAQPNQDTSDAAKPQAPVAAAVEPPPGLQPRTKAKPIARAARKVAGKTAGMAHPAAAPLPAAAEVRLPELKSTEAIAMSANVLELKQPRKGQRRK